MADAEQNIVVNIRAITKGFGTLTPQFTAMRNQVENQTKAIRKMKQPLTATDAVSRTTFTNMNENIQALGNTSANFMPKFKDSIKQVSVAGAGMGRVFGMSMGTLKEVNEKGFQKGFTRAGRFANRVRMLTHGMRGFRMEMLGVMFFGMAMQKWFTGMLRPAAELLGIFDLWRITLQVLFLPVLILLMPYLLDLLETIINLSPATKTLIGWFVIFGAILGTFLFNVGMISLGLGSVIQAFPSLGSAIAKLAPLLKPLGIIFSIITILWMSDLGGFRNWVKTTLKEIGGLFMTAFELIGNVVSFVINVITGDFEGMEEDWGKIGENLLDIIIRLGTMMINIFNYTYNAILDLTFNILVKGILKAIELLHKGMAKIPGAIGQPFRDSAGELDTLLASIEGKAAEIKNNMKMDLRESGDIRKFLFENFGVFADEFGGGKGQEYLDKLPGNSSGQVSDDSTNITSPYVPFKLPSNITGQGNNINITQNLTVSGSFKEEVEKMLDENNKTLVDDLRRISPVGGG